MTVAAPPDRLAQLDFDAHNAEVAAMWQAFRDRKPTRIPIIVGTNSRYFMFRSDAEPERTTFKTYMEDPDVMFDKLLQYARWSRFNILQDAELGLPKIWYVVPDSQNFYEAAWFGCPIHYMDDQVPDTDPAFTDCPERVMEKGLPDPFGGFMATVLRYFEHFKERAAREQFLDRPIQTSPGWAGPNTDGPMTVACSLFGAGFVCEAMLEQPRRIHDLLAFITEATIARIKAWRKWADRPVPYSGFGFADDSVALISKATYIEHVLPHHRRLCDAMATPEPRHIHLCGNATHLFKTIRDELNVQTFDTGFPVDFGRLRRELGPGVQIQGGPHVELLLRGTPQDVRTEVTRILSSGVLEGGRFLLREGNNLAPGTPLENIEAMVATGRELGVFST